MQNFYIEATDAKGTDAKGTDAVPMRESHFAYKP